MIANAIQRAIAADPQSQTEATVCLNFAATVIGIARSFSAWTSIWQRGDVGWAKRSVPNGRGWQPPGIIQGRATCRVNPCYVAAQCHLNVNAVSVDSAKVRAIAELARLAIPTAQEAAIATELSAVLDLFDALAAAPVDALTPLSHPGDPHLRLRADLVTEGDQREAFAVLAPAESAGYYLVPKVIE